MSDTTPMGGYDVDLCDGIDEEAYVCCICQLVYRDPVQTPCGHNCCQSCLSKCPKTKDGFTKCPLDNSKLDMDKVFADKALERRVLNLKVKCNSAGKGCLWTGELRALQEHTQVTCTYIPVLCTYRCGKYVPSCQMESHLKVCVKSKEKTSCAYANIGCTFVGTNEKQGKHEKSEMKHHLILHKQAVQEISKETPTQSSKEENKQNKEEPTNSKVDKKPKKDSKVDTKQKKEKANKVNDKLYLASKESFVFKWQITDYHEKFETSLKTQKFINSDPFYCNGYKLRLKANLYGVSENKGKSVCLALQLMKGHSDEKLRWPFSHTYTLSLLHPQHDTRHISETIDPSDVSYEVRDNFRKPRATHVNNGCGTSNLFHHDVILKGGFIEDDTVCFQCNIY